MGDYDQQLLSYNILLSFTIKQYFTNNTIYFLKYQGKNYK